MLDFYNKSCFILLLIMDLKLLSFYNVTLIVLLKHFMCSSFFILTLNMSDVKYIC